MILIIHFLVVLPFVGFVISLFLPARQEAWISRAAFLSVGLHALLTDFFLAYWLWRGAPTLDVKDWVLFRSTDYEFFIDFIFDQITAVYLFVGSLLTFLVTVYSRHYLHREKGYKRFFNTVLLFYFGYTVVVLSGNFETLFIGWEILGVSSFLLIAFYRDRYLPVKNAVKVFSIYRIGDVGLILAMWMSHHLWHENVTFLKMSNDELVSHQLLGHSWVGIFISLMILVAAAGKSAQLPFSTWLPRAMEGPTPSSAIFYGSLSVHMGAFLLLRTFPFWEHQLSVRVAIGVLGLATSLVSTGVARVQSSVKSQIAYSSIAQIGLIFIEIALGLPWLALIHFAGNAFLRTYQLLVSPSVVSYLIREQLYTGVPKKHTIAGSLKKRIEYTLYIWCLKEGNLDSFMFRVLWSPIKKAGNLFRPLATRAAWWFFLPVYGAGLIALFLEAHVPPGVRHALPIVFSLIGLLMVFKSFTERIHVRSAWLLIILNHFWVALALSFNEHYVFSHVALYLSGIILAGVAGYLSLQRLKLLEGSIDMDRFHGHSYHHPRIAFVFLIACLCATGFPITPTFIGEDLIFSHIPENQLVLAFLTSLSFIVDGLAIIRIYARVFLGPHSSSVFDMAYRSS